MHTLSSNSPKKTKDKLTSGVRKYKQPYLIWKIKLIANLSSWCCWWGGLAGPWPSAHPHFCHLSPWRLICQHWHWRLCTMETQLPEHELHTQPATAGNTLLNWHEFPHIWLQICCSTCLETDYITEIPGQGRPFFPLACCYKHNSTFQPNVFLHKLSRYSLPSHIYLTLSTAWKPTAHLFN